MSDESIDRAAIGRRLRRLRTEQLSLTGAALARTIGVSQSFVSEVEHGRSGPSVRMLKGLMEEYDADPRWILTGRGAPTRVESPAGVHPEMQSLADAIRRLPVLGQLVGSTDPDEGLSPQSRELLDRVRSLCREADPATFVQLEGFVRYLDESMTTVKDTG